jgi:hypothetical protein
MIFLNAAVTGNADWFLTKPPALNTFKIYSAILSTQNVLDFVAYTKLQEAFWQFVSHLEQHIYGFHSPFRVKINKTTKVRMTEIWRTLA